MEHSQHTFMLILQLLHRRLAAAVLQYSPLLPSIVQIHDAAGLQVLRDLRLPHILLYIRRADPRPAKVSGTDGGSQTHVVAFR